MCFPKEGPGFTLDRFQIFEVSEIVECPIIIIVNVPEVALRIMANEKTT